MHYDPQEKHIEMMKHAPRAMAYKPGEDFSAWQVAARAKLSELLGLPLEMPQSDMFTVEWERDEPNFREIRFYFCSEPQVDVCCHLLLPHGQEGKLPLIICLQGHSKGAHISLGRTIYEGDAETIANDWDFAIQAVDMGYAALVMEQRAFGERGGSSEGPQCYQPAVQALLLGRTLVGERCWDVSRGIDCVMEHFSDEIDADKIALLGGSGGGTVVCYASALDERIAAAIPAVAFCGYMESIGVQRHCICNYVPGIMKYFDMGDIGGLIAPRPVVIVNGDKDPIFPLASAQEQAKITRKLYEVAGAPENVRTVVGAGEHRFYAKDTWPVFNDLVGWQR